MFQAFRNVIKIILIAGLNVRRYFRLQILTNIEIGKQTQNILSIPVLNKRKRKRKSMKITLER